MNNLIRLITVAFLYLAIAFTAPFAIADTVDSNAASSLQQAAQKVVEDDGAKDQFGKSDNGEQLLDSAKTKASKKLTDLADADSEDLPESKKLFLKNLKAE